MTTEYFWFGWLRITIIFVIILGAILAITAPFLTLNILDNKINTVFFSDGIPGESAEMMRKWLIAVSGAVMLGWGCSMLFIVEKALRYSEKWAWRSMFYPIIIWYVLDSLVSMYFGAIFNAVINSIIFLQLLAPLLFLRNQFNKQLKVIR
jgi:hypothetical protein